ncbi:SMI1/KNR4 family protein [Agaribacter marinus]|uniref:Knr4/Smi1-like domain-containing protein n=1 Tax=Agaribacter marinus TaxID=1431249 RepID=A0AA37SVP7_9ALTE|nr:SMI1/KNR4 family protein [Agaribacter marinus]GLR70242.1 hypothetical protein GCM10007852_11500 [Agaribacter marinus]
MKWLWKSAPAGKYSDQLTRIKKKLAKAKSFDKDLKVFGADSHKYKVGKCISKKQIAAFEERYSIGIPECYKSFLTHIGNGGISYCGSSAGPFYGIYPMEYDVNEFVDNPELSLHKTPSIFPRMSDNEWELLTSKINVDDISDEEYEEECHKIYSGLLCIGSQGCQSYHALILNGEHAGRIVNIDTELSKPKFAYEDNFLDWYERWLDEILLGILLQDGPSWFGYTMGGDGSQLLAYYFSSQTKEDKIEALAGLLKLADVTEKDCKQLLDIGLAEKLEIRRQAIQILAKFNYSMAKRPLSRLLQENDADCLAGCQAIYWYAKDNANEWVDILRTRLPSVENEETYRFITYILAESGTDYSDALIPFCSNRSEEIRVITYYALGKLKDKSSLVVVFSNGLADESPRVVHSTLQAFRGLKDKRIFKAYRQIIERFPKEEHFILINLGHHLKELGFSGRKDFAHRYDGGEI